jgi:hypothetical protein
VVAASYLLSVTDQQTLDDLTVSHEQSDSERDMATQTHQLRSKPVEDFTVEDLRILIGRQLSLRNLVPVAIEVLQENPLAEGRYYPGDLLQAVLEVDRQYWRSNREQWEAVSEIAESVAFAQMKLSEALLRFQARPV